jgi:hypothetical protein
MATFLVLPPRELIEHAVAEFAGRLLPGFPVPAGLWERFVDDLVSANETDADGHVFVLHREDLSDGSVNDSLVEGFGAEPGDCVVEIDSPRPNQPGKSRRWAVGGVRRSEAIV